MHASLFLVVLAGTLASAIGSFKVMCEGPINTTTGVNGCSCDSKGQISCPGLNTKYEDYCRCGKLARAHHDPFLKRVRLLTRRHADVHDQKTTAPAPLHISPGARVAEVTEAAMTTEEPEGQRPEALGARAGG
jgi:hypothetical protein